MNEPVNAEAIMLGHHTSESRALLYRPAISRAYRFLRVFALSHARLLNAANSAAILVPLVTSPLRLVAQDTGLSRR